VIVWVLEYEFDWDMEGTEIEVVGVFDDADKAKCHVPEVTWKETPVGFEARGQRAESTWHLVRYELNEYQRPCIAPDWWIKV